MRPDFVNTISQELSIKPAQVESTATLLDEGGTVPFIARYRKEQTGGLDEVKVIAIRDRMKALTELNDRLDAILESLSSRDLLDEALEERLRAADTLTKLEDIYLPFRPKKQTKAMVAKAKGLEPLALAIMTQTPSIVPLEEAEKAIADGAEAATPLDALSMAKDIIVERISENEDARSRLRELFRKEAVLTSRVKADMEEQATKFRDYFDFSESISTIPSHRYLAVKRGEASNFLIVRIQPDPVRGLDILRRLFIINGSPSAALVEEAMVEAYKHHLSLSMETEIRLETKRKADLEAVGYFSQNLRDLLMAPPLKDMPVLAVDPGLRTGSKMVALSANGDLLDHATFQPLAKGGERDRVCELIRGIINKYAIKVVAVGNGTGGRETYTLIRSIPDFPKDVPVIMASEVGASIYSASPVAREEFPDLDLTIRGAISIGRRLIDPLAELVKIDPKSIGVGQYQYDVDQTLLKDNLDDVVISCVNSVGVEVNTASEKLLSYVSGLGPSLAKNIVKYRQEKGPFKSRFELRSVPRLGPKAFQLSAGFLRVAASDNPLDRSAVHPESYPVVEKMACDLKVPVSQLVSEPLLRAKIKPSEYVSGNIGLPTITDIISELEKPGRDPRESFNPFEFSDEASSINDLTIGQNMTGVVTNLTAFGAFVDLGVHVNGLLHISQIRKSFVKKVSDHLKLGQRISVWIKDIELEQNRISLTMIDPAENSDSAAPQKNTQTPNGTPTNGTPPKAGNSLAQALDLAARNNRLGGIRVVSMNSKERRS
jgi:uncharacterized protein